MPAFWGVVRSLPGREVFAAERLRMDGGFEVFLPLVQTQRASAPLFAGYFFCRIVDRWRSINGTSASCAWSGLAIARRGAPTRRSTALRP
jgi:hypothetical protein